MFSCSDTELLSLKTALTHKSHCSFAPPLLKLHLASCVFSACAWIVVREVCKKFPSKQDTSYDGVQ